MASTDRIAQRGLLWIGVLAASTVACRAQSLDLKTYASPTGEYTVEYPASWRQYGDAISLYLENFPPEKTRPQVALPDNGAKIGFEVIRPKPKSLEDWIENDSKHRPPNGRRTFVLRLQHEPEEVPVIEIISRSTWKEMTSRTTWNLYELEQVNWYFSVRGHLFNADLLYYKGDPQGDEYREVLKKVVSSIRVVR